MRTKPRQSGTFFRFDGSGSEPPVSAATALEAGEHGADIDEVRERRVTRDSVQGMPPDSHTKSPSIGARALFDGDARNTDDARPMSPGMTKKKSGTQLRAQGSAGGPTDLRLAPGAVIVVDGDEVGRKAIKEAVARVLGAEVATFPDLRTLEAYIHPHSTRRCGRPPVRGFLIDWELGKRRGPSFIETLAWLDRVYPRTPVVTYTGAPDLLDVERICAGSEHTVVPLGRSAGSGPLRQAALAVARLPVQRTVILARDRISDLVLTAVDTQWFEPWDVRRLHARSWLIAQPPSGAAVLEYQLRTIEAYFDSVTRDELAHARGVEPSTLAQHEKEIGALWSRPLDSLKQLWERSRDGRGAASSPSFLDSAERSNVSEAPPHQEGERPRPPRTPRPSARRSR